MKRFSMLFVAALASLPLVALEVNAEEKMRTYKDLGGQTKTKAWWKELASCGGTLAGIMIDFKEDKPNEAKALNVEINKVVGWSVKRMMIDSGITKEVAEENAMNEGSDWVEYYQFETEDMLDKKAVAAYQQEQIALCRNIANDYKSAFPQDAN